VEVTVSDTGAGIEMHHRRHLFEPFYTTEAAPEGVGLGLSVCHALVQSFGGTIHVESEIGCGSTFRVVLPISHRAPVAPAPTAAPIAAPGPDPLSILIVEDEAHLAESLALLLDEHHVTVALGGRQALDACKARDFDLILCDLLMPVVTGMDVYEELRRRGGRHEQRIVFMTGGAFTIAAQQFLASIPNPTLEKPFATETLLQLVATTADARASARS
jgi:CheY-like chemotaxis protein